MHLWLRKGGLGVVARDEKGDILFASTRGVHAWWPLEVAESNALLLAIKHAKSHDYDIILESDSQVLVSHLSKAVYYYSNLDSVLEDTSSFSCHFNSIVWYHVKSNGNIVTHHLAKLVPFGIEQVWKHHCYLEISPYVLSNILSIYVFLF